MIGAVSTDRCLVLFTKPARPGRVKTRLVGDLTPEEAARIHSAFVADVTRRLAAAREAGRFDVVLAWALDDPEDAESGEIPVGPVPGLTGVRQHGATLGDRLYRALADAGRDHRVVAALGSDHPHLPIERIEEAFERIEAAPDAGREPPVVVGPAEDGGYYLIAVAARALTPEIFRDVPWSTDRVLAVTRERCRAAGLPVEELETGWDVDHPADLKRLARYLEAHPELCRETHRLLRDELRVFGSGTER